jgi:hypothetical protein
MHVRFYYITSAKCVIDINATVALLTNELGVFRPPSELAVEFFMSFDHDDLIAQFSIKLFNYSSTVDSYYRPSSLS